MFSDFFSVTTLSGPDSVFNISILFVFWKTEPTKFVTKYCKVVVNKNNRAGGFGENFFGSSRTGIFLLSIKKDH